MEDGLCVTRHDIQFYTDDTELPFDERPAKELCSTCVVRDECLEHALENNEMWGIWGGFNPIERDAMMRRQPMKIIGMGRSRPRPETDIPQSVTCPKCRRGHGNAAMNGPKTARCYDCKFTWPVL